MTSHSLSRRTVLAGAAGLAFAGHASAQSGTEIVVGLPSTSLGAAMPRLTGEMGLYAKHGLQARQTLLESAAVATAALVSRSVQVIQAGPAELVAAQANGQKTIALGTAYAGFAQSLILSNAAAAKVGVAPTATVAARMKAIDGLLIATASATSGATVALKLAALKLAGVNVRFTYIAQANFISAMERGAIDGYIGSAPYSTLGVAKKLGVMWLNGPGGDLPAELAPANAGIIMMMREYADANPAVVKSVIAAYTDFSTAVRERPAEVKAVVARLFPELDQPTLDLFYASESKSWQFTPITVQQMAHEIRFVKESGTPLPNADKLDPVAMVLG